MHILVVGLNHHTAPVEVRERFTISSQDLTQALLKLKHTASILECVILTTCHRTEFYVVVDRHHSCVRYISGFIEQWFHISRDQFKPYLFSWDHEQAVKHLFRVTSGLDSMMIGETQILGQVRSAFLHAQSLQTTGKFFNKLFKQAITFAKRAHSETSISETPVSISYAAIEMGKRILGSYHHKKVMIIGAGKMSELAIKHLASQGLQQLVIVNRTYERALELANQFNAVPCRMEDMMNQLVDVDLLVSSTGASEFIITAEDLQSVMPNRTNGTLLMMDIAVPRDIDPQVNKFPHVCLYDIDDLEIIVESHVEQRHKEATYIESMIVSEMIAYEQWMQTLEVRPVIQALQEKANMIHEETLNSLLQKLPELNEHQQKVIRKLTKSMMSQLLRDPILRLKELAPHSDSQEMLTLCTALFALDEMSEIQDVLSSQQKQSVKENEPVKVVARKSIKPEAINLNIHFKKEAITLDARTV
jgi:glutamyl-tRNA reductase